MAIDLRHEPLISFHEASRLFPKSRRGKHPHLSSLYRWASRGVHGIRLETVMAGGKRATSVAAVARFIAQVSEASELGQLTQLTSNSTRMSPSTAVTQPVNFYNEREVAAALDAVGICAAKPSDTAGKEEN